MNIQPATGLTAWVLRRTGFKGVTLPWGIRVLAEEQTNERLIRHEREHARQVEELGVVRFYATYLWQVVRYGYRNAPLEIKAREAENG